MTPFWKAVNESQLHQSDLLPNCVVPIIPPSFGPHSRTTDLLIHTIDLVVLTQSCDLAKATSGLVALCTVHSLADFEAVNPNFTKKGAWEDVRKGRREGLHLLASPTNPANGRDALVVDFRGIHSLPFEYLTQYASTLGERWRLDSPFLEHFSQAFARFFMRVGLPSTVPEIK